MVGDYQDIHLYNREHTEGYSAKVLSFVRWSDDEKLIIVSNFDNKKSYGFELKIPKHVIEPWKLAEKTYDVEDQLYNQFNTTLIVENGIGTIKIKLDALQSFILKIK